MRTSTLLAEHESRFVRTCSYAARYGARYDDIVGELNSLGIDPYCAISSYHFSISFTGNRDALNKAFGILRKHGLEPDSRPQELSTSYSSFFNDTEENSKGPQFSIWFSFTSSQCRKVVTGTHMEEVEDYEIICDEGDSK